MDNKIMNHKELDVILSLIPINRGNVFFKVLLITFLFSVNYHSYGIDEDRESKMNDKVVELYFVRHGKTLFNTVDRVQGWADSPLTNEGIIVAEDLGRGLKDIEFLCVFTSDAGRQRETAQIIMKFNKNEKIPTFETTDLREWYFGSFEGDFGKNMRKAIANLNDNFNGDNSQQSFTKISIQKIADNIADADTLKEAENWQSIETRVKNALDTITKKALEEDGGNVLVVTSGLTISSLLYTIDPSQSWIGVKNASVSKVVYRNGKHLVESFNDMKYVENGKVLR